MRKKAFSRVLNENPAPHELRENAFFGYLWESIFEKSSMKNLLPTSCGKIVFPLLVGELFRREEQRAAESSRERQGGAESSREQQGAAESTAESTREQQRAAESSREQQRAPESIREEQRLAENSREQQRA